MPPGAENLADPHASPSLPSRNFSRQRLFRAYLTLVMGLLSVGGGAMAAAHVLGFSESPSAESFIAAALLGAVGVVSWAVVTATRDAGNAAGVLAWVAFPIALFSVVGMVPLLCMAVVPEIAGNLGSPDRVVLHRRGTALTIEFPRRVKNEAINLELDGTPVPADYFALHPARAAWEHQGGPRGRSYLTIDLEGLRADLGLPPVRQVGLNRVLSAPQITGADGKRFQPQRLPVPQGFP